MSPASTIPVRRKFETIKSMKEKHPCLEIRWMCDRLNVSPSGYYSYLKATKRPADRQELDDMDLIRWAYDFKGRAKGARQI